LPDEGGANRNPSGFVPRDCGSGRGEERNPDFSAVIDDREARRCATALHCRHIGTLGIIVLAKRKSIIPSIRSHMERLKEAGLWLSDALVDQVCRKSGE
jgi:predicted nucleic acid-binding protein